MLKLSLIVPCYNEENNVQAFYARCAEVFDNTEFEVVFVNDGSSDNTYAELKRLNQQHNNILVVNFSRNFGKESAIYAGLHYAKGEYISVIDADMQQDPTIVRTMTDILDVEEDTDVVATYQENRHEGKVLSWWKKRFYGLINKLSEIEMKQNASDFRTFRRSVQQSLLDMPEYFRFSKGLFAWVGFETKYIPYEVNDRLSGTTKWSFWGLVKYALSGIVSFSTMPLHIATVIGTLISAIAALYGVSEIVKTLIMGKDVPGYATIVVLILFLGGLQLLVLGIMGEYLAKTYIQGKKRPNYIVKRVLEKKEDEEV